MKKIKRFLAVMLIASLIFVSGGFFHPDRAVSSTVRLKITGPSSVIAGEVYKVTVSITDSEGNPFLSKQIAVGVAATSGIDGIPVFFKFSKGNKGTRTFNVKFLKSGIAEIKVFDLNSPDVFAKYNVVVSPGPITSISVNPREITVYNGETYKFGVELSDTQGNISNDISSVNVEVDPLEGSAHGNYLGDGRFQFYGEGKCQVVFEKGTAFSSVNVFVVKDKRDFLFVNLKSDNFGFRVNSGYEITIKNGGKKIEKGNTIKLYFPVDVLFPCPCHKKILNTDILFNGKNLLQNPSLDCNGFWHILTFKSVSNVKPYETFTINVRKSAGILNPMRDKKFLVGVFVAPYSHIYYSNFQTIGNLIDTPKLYAFPSITARNADFVFVFHTLKGFKLEKGSPMGLVFPYGSILPDFPNASNFSINGYSLWKGSVITKWNKNTYVITLPFDLGPNQTVVINVSKNAGITLPPYEGYYNGGIIYDFSILTVRSTYLYVKYAPLMEVYSHLPESHSSINGLYDFNPQISLNSVSTYGYVKTTIMYSVDNPDEFNVYEKPFTVKGEGTHIIQYYAVNTLGIKTSLHTLKLVIDTTPPAITLKEIVRVKGNKKKYVFSSSEVLSSVYVNGYYTICGLNKEFYAILPGKVDKLTVNATDLAGNTKKEIFKP